MRFHTKAEALDKIARHLGLFRDLPPLEAVLALLPPPLAAAVRAELADVLPERTKSFPTAESGEGADEVSAEARDDTNA